MDDNTFECPQCGADVYPEMTRCPVCGHNMYPEDEEHIPPVVETSKNIWGSLLGAVLLGIIIASGISLIIHFIVASFVAPGKLAIAAIVILFVAGPIGALVGGYVGGGLRNQNAVLLGGVIGALLLPVLALFATHWVEVTPGFLLSPFVLAISLTSILSGMAGGWLNLRLSQNNEWKEKWQVRGWEDLLYQDLLRKVRFNGSVADRLIEYERQQDPQASRLKLIQNAIERWERDNR